MLVLSTALSTHIAHLPPGDPSYTTLGRLALYLAHFCQGLALLGLYMIVMGGAMWIARSTLPGAIPLGEEFAEEVEAAMKAASGARGKSKSKSTSSSGGGAGVGAGGGGGDGGESGPWQPSPRMMSALVTASFVGYTLAPWVLPVLAVIRLPSETRDALLCFAAAAAWSFLVAALPPAPPELEQGAGITGRGLHPSTFRLNVSAFCGIGGAFRGYYGVLRINRGY